MRVVNGIALMVAAVALAACDNGPGRFGGGGNDDVIGGSGIGLGGISDPTSVAYFQETVGDRVLFSVDQSTLDSQSRAVLDGQAAWLISNPAFNVVIEGHADERGTTQYNLALGARRAAAVQEYLFSQGIALNRMTTASFGKERPLEICSDEVCYSQNRRAATVLRAGAGV